MDLSESLKQQIKELDNFIKKQNNHIKNYQVELNKNIDTVEDKEIKTKMNVMMNEAMNGNLSNVQAIAQQLQNDLEMKNKKESENKI